MVRFFACAAALLLPTAAANIDPAIYERIFLSNKPMFDAMTEEVKKAVPEGGKILDLGAGPGEPTTTMATALPSSRVVSTDLQEAMIEKAKKRAGSLSNVDFAVTSADDLSAYPDNSFAAVTMCYVLMFVPDKAKSIQEVTRVLQPGGHAMIAVWKDLRFMSEVKKAMRKLLGKKPPEMSMNPEALSGPTAVEDIVNAAALPLEVVSSEFVIYPLSIGDNKQACEAAKMLVGQNLEELESSGEVEDATEEFCEIFTSNLVSAGYQEEDGSFAVKGNVAQLMVLKKPAAGEKRGGEL